jgi:hypothetical protein
VPSTTVNPTRRRSSGCLKLPRYEYDRVRVKEAEALGIRPATLDKEVEALRPKGGDAGPGHEFPRD